MLFEAFLDRDKSQYLRFVDRYHDLLFGSFLTVKEFQLTPDNSVFLKNVNIDFIEREGLYFPHAFLDLVMDNILMTPDGGYYCIDYEWIIPAPFPVTFVFFRSLSTFYGFKYGEFNVEGFMPFADLMNRYGITAYHLEQYENIEKNFQNYIVGDRLYNRSRYLKKRIFLNELMSCIDGTQQRLNQTYEEKIQQLTHDREKINEVVQQGEVRKGKANRTDQRQRRYDSPTSGQLFDENREDNTLSVQIYQGDAFSALDNQFFYFNHKEPIMKCDVIIPVYNAPDWVRLCVRRLISQTPDEYLNQIILVDDDSNAFTKGLSGRSGG